MKGKERRRNLRWTLGAKLGIAFGSVVCLVMVVAAIAAYEISGLTGASAGVVRASIPAVDRCLKLESEIRNALSTYRGYMVFGDDSFRVEQEEAWERIDEHLAAVKAMSGSWTEERRSQLAELGRVAEELHAAQLEIEHVAHTEDDLPATKRFVHETIPIADRAVEHLDEILREETTLASTDERKELAIEVAKAEIYLFEVRGAIAAFLETGDVALVETMNEAVDACADSIARIDAMSALFTPAQLEAFGAYSDERLAFLASADLVVTERADPGFCVSESLSRDVVKPLATQASALIASLVEYETGIRDTASAEVERAGDEARSSLPLIAGVAGLAVVIGSAVSWCMGRSISRAVKRVSGFAERIASHDLTHTEFDLRRSDEIGTLGWSVKRMAGSLRSLIEEVTSATHEVGSAAVQIAASNDQMADAIRRQSTEVDQIAAAVTEMTASIGEVASRSEEAAQQAEASGQTASSGGQIVHQTVEGMGAIDTAVRESARSVEELGRRGEQIGGIIETINEIAEQTNLLALNAAIEAARAGEHGRGFAVVADEVRKLAERTTVATEEVTQSVNAIQRETSQAVERMNHGTTHVETGVGLATEAGSSLEEIVESATSVRSMIATIAEAARQQSEAAAGVSRGVESINTESSQTVAATEQSAAAASQLAAKAEHLSGLVSAFKL